MQGIVVLLGKLFDGFGIVELFILHDELDGIAACAAAETVVDLFLRGDDEAGALLVMKRADRLEIGTGFFDLDVVADDVEDVEAAFQPFNGVLGNHKAILTKIGFRRRVCRHLFLP